MKNFKTLLKNLHKKVVILNCKIHFFFTTCYHNGMTFKKIITPYYDGTKWFLVSQYTGEIAPVNFKSLISLIKNFNIKINQ